MNGNLTSSGSECKAFQTKNITDIRFLEICIGACSVNLYIVAFAVCRGACKLTVTKVSLRIGVSRLGEYSGAADWYKLEQNLLLAKPFIENPDPYNATTGYTKESYDPLVESYNAAMALYNDKEAYDCEQQTDIDRVADDLYAKIFEIVYNSVTDLIVNPDSGANIVIKKIDPIIDASWLWSRNEVLPLRYQSSIDLSVPSIRVSPFRSP